MGDRLKGLENQELQMNSSFGKMPSASSYNHENSMIREGGAYDMGELDQALFLFLDGHDHSAGDIQEHKKTLNIFPSQPMHVHEDPSTKDGLSLVSSTSTSMRSTEQSSDIGNPKAIPPGKGKDIKTSRMKEESKKCTASSSEQGSKTLEEKTLRRLAQNREAAKKSRLRKKVYIQQLEHSRIKYIQLEQELQRTRSTTQGLYQNAGSSTSNELNSVFDMEYGRWKEEHHILVCELKAAVQEEQQQLLHENGVVLQVYVDKLVAHHDEMMNIKIRAVKLDVFHILSGMWVSPAERCFMWMGGFRPSHLIKIIFRHIEPQTEQQILGIYDLQQSIQQTEETLIQGLESLHQSLYDTINSDALRFPSDMANFMAQMSVAMNKLTTIQGIVSQADNLRQYTIHRLRQTLTTRQAALCFLAMEDYFHRLRALSSLWVASPRTI